MLRAAERAIATGIVHPVKPADLPIEQPRKFDPVLTSIPRAYWLTIADFRRGNGKTMRNGPRQCISGGAAW
jgi:hypothetical protein